MRCPNPKCRREIPLDAVEHPLCGWKLPAKPPPRDVAPPTVVPPPVVTPDPPFTREQAIARLQDIRRMLATALTVKKLTPLEHWVRVRDNPRTLPHIRQWAIEAIARLEARAENLREQQKIRDGAALQERAREVTQSQLRREAREREEFMRRISEANAPAPRARPPARDVKPQPSGKPVDTVDKPVTQPARPPAKRFSEQDLAADPLELEAQADRAADPRRSGGNVSRGTSRGASQTPKDRGYRRARSR